MENTPNYGWPYPGSGDHTRTWEYWQNLATAADASLKTVNDNLAASVAAKAPYAMFTGRYAVTFSNHTWRPATVTFPVGRFTQAPILLAVAEDSNAAMFAFVTAIATTTGATVGVRKWDGVAFSGQVGVAVAAFQMTSGAGPGRALTSRTPERQYTCRTPDCGNSNIEIAAPFVDGAEVICGVCGAPIAAGR